VISRVTEIGIRILPILSPKDLKKTYRTGTNQPVVLVAGLATEMVNPAEGNFSRPFHRPDNRPE
jgi:hypothetical protein